MAAARTNRSPSTDIEALLEAGLARRAAGDFVAAEAMFRQALAQAPADPTALYILGLARFEAGDAAEAERLLGEVTAMRPGHAQAQLTLASVRHWRDKRPEAIAAYRRAVELDPTNVAALTGLSRALAESGAPEAALQAARAAAAVAPEDAAVHLAQASAHRDLGDVREAADAFARAAQLAPDLAAAHVGAALALIDLGEASPAAEAAARAVALEPGLCDGWLALGAALRALHRPGEACAALQRAVTIAPERAAAHLNLGLAYIDLEEATAARSHLERALELDPASAKAHANLSSLYVLAGRPELARAHAERALEIDPDLMSAHQNLAALFADARRHDEARHHRDRAYGERNLVITVAAEPLRRVLILTTTESGNTPDRHLIPPASYTRLLWFIEYASERQMAQLPPFDVAFNAIGDEDLAGPTAANARRFAEICSTRLINPPQLIARTRRDLAAELFAGVEGVVVPRTVRIEAAELAHGDVREAAARAGIEGSFLVRPIGSHGGKGLLKVEPDGPLEAPPPARAYYLTQFHDIRGADGRYRKHRTIFADGEALPYHLAISPNWMVHYESSGMEERPDLLAEETRFLEDPAAVLGRDAAAAVAAIGAAMGLDYAGVDYALLPDGRVLVFEANATMLVHPEAPDGPLAHKNPAIERILAAFRAMLAKVD